MDTRVDVYKPEKIKLKPYEHHVKYYETDQMRISVGWKRRGWT